PRATRRGPGRAPVRAVREHARGAQEPPAPVPGLAAPPRRPRRRARARPRVRREARLAGRRLRDRARAVALPRRQDRPARARRRRGAGAPLCGLPVHGVSELLRGLGSARGRIARVRQVLRGVVGLLAARGGARFRRLSRSPRRRGGDRADRAGDLRRGPPREPGEDDPGALPRAQLAGGRRRGARADRVRRARLAGRALGRLAGSRARRDHPRAPPPAGRGTRRPVGRALSLHVARELVFPTFFTLTGLTMLAIVAELVAYADLVVNRGFGFRDVAQIALLSTLPMVGRAIPYSMLLGALIALGRLAADREILAIQASGVSPLRLFAPVASFAAVLAVIAVWSTPVV